MKQGFFTFFFLTLVMPLLSAPSTLRIPNLNGVTTLNYQTGIDLLGNSTIAYTFTNKGRQNIFVQAITLSPRGEQVNRSPGFEFDPSLPGLNIPSRNYQLAVSSSGNVLLVWTVHLNNRSVIMAGFMPFTPPATFGNWVATQLSSSLFNTTDFNAAIDEEGNAVVAWRLSNSLTPSRSVVQAAYKPVHGDWEIPGNPNNQAAVLSPLAFSVSATPSVGIARGNATVAWQVYNGINGISGTNVVQAAYRAKDFSFEVFRDQPESSIDPRNQSAVLSTIGFRVASPPLVTAAGGTSLVTWQIVGNPNTSLPDNVIQAFVRFF